MKVLITGSAGFIGFHLTKTLLENGDKVVGLDNLNNYPLLNKNQFNKLKFFTHGIWSESGIKRFYAPTNSNYVSHSIINIQHMNEYFEAECITIKEMMRQLGHNKLDILKLDIEGAEYEVIDSILNDDIKIKILCVEFDNLHRPQNSNFLNIGEKYIAKLIKAGFKPIFRSWTDFTFINESYKNV